MAWIELHQDFRNHPKAIRLASFLGVSVPTAKGYIINLWLWVSTYAPNGDLTKFTAEEIARACEAEGDPKAFVEALQKAEWIDKKSEKIVVHDWKKHGMKLLISNRDRQRKWRESKKLEKEGKPLSSRRRNVTITPTIPNHTIPNHTIPKKEKNAPRRGPENVLIPPELTSEEFLRVWQEWKSHRKEKRKPLTERQELKQLEWLRTQPNPVEIVAKSIRNGWQGLFPLDGDRDGKQARTTRKVFTHDDLNRTVEHLTGRSNRREEGAGHHGDSAGSGDSEGGESPAHRATASGVNPTPARDG